MERVKNILLVAVVVALVAPAMASVGYGVEWSGAASSDWANSANWSGSIQNEFYTINGRWSNPGPAALISAGVDMTHGGFRVYGGHTINQTGGNVRFIPASDVWKGFVMYNISWQGAVTNQVNISGGTFRVDDGLGLDSDLYENHSAGYVGENKINVSGAGTLQLFLSGLEKPNGYLLYIGANSVITIADDGKFVVDPFFKTQVDAHITANKIVGIGNDLTTAFDNDGNYVVSVIPEPATMALLGLGAVALLRRKR